MMGGIFGLFYRDGCPVPMPVVDMLSAGMAGWGRCETWGAGCGILGRAHGPSGPPIHHGPQNGEGVAFVAAGRVDNPEELRLQLPEAASSPPVTDSDLIRHVYLAWGEECVKRIHGDWSFAAWHPAERKMFVARDHFGITSLYYYADERVLAFASERKALLALDLAPVEMDELYLAQVLVSWQGYHGARTIHKPIHRLPPAHSLAATPDRIHLDQYWRLEDTPLLRLRRREDYIFAFRDVFDEAVRARLRSPCSNGENPGPNGGVAVSLSGGLDSGSVTATAAGLLQPSGKRITAFTAIPLSDTSIYVGDRFGDELPFAQATVNFAGNVDHVPIATADITPVQAVRRMLQVHDEPGHAAGNLFWMLDLQQTAAMRGYRVLLNGQMGNAGISWQGDVFSQPLAFQLRTMGYKAWAKERIKQIVPFGLMKIWRLRHIPPDWHRGSAIHPDFAKRLRLIERRLSDVMEFPRTPLENRCGGLQPGRSLVGAIQAESGAALGLEIRDPTADARVLAFSLSVPSDVFIDPETGLDRWLIREAMKGRLPDVVRLNRRRGRQAGDLAPRLRASEGEVNAALDELGRGPAAEYVDVPYMRWIWEAVRTRSGPEVFRRAGSVLMRGIMAGLWVNDFFNGRRVA